MDDLRAAVIVVGSLVGLHRWYARFTRRLCLVWNLLFLDVEIESLMLIILERGYLWFLHFVSFTVRQHSLKFSTLAGDVLCIGTLGLRTFDSFC